MTAIQNSIQACGLPVENLGAIGFSNGGAAVSALFRDDYFLKSFAPIHWGVVIGYRPKRLPLQAVAKKRAGSLVFLYGARDPFTLGGAPDLYSALNENNESVLTMRIIGGHFVPLHETRVAILQAQLRSSHKLIER